MKPGKILFSFFTVFALLCASIAPAFAFEEENSAMAAVSDGQRMGVYKSYEVITKTKYKGRANGTVSTRLYASNLVSAEIGPYTDYDQKWSSSTGSVVTYTETSERRKFTSLSELYSYIVSQGQTSYGVPSASCWMRWRTAGGEENLCAGVFNVYYSPGSAGFNNSTLSFDTNNLFFLDELTTETVTEKGAYLGQQTVAYGQYPSSGIQGGHWYELTGSYYIPTTPGSISYAGTREGNPLPVSWGASADSDNDLSGYVLERSVNGAAYTQVYRGNTQTYTDTAQASWNTVAYRVKAADAAGHESGYRTGSATVITHNSPPVIDGEDIDAGPQTGGMEISYTVTDPDPGDVITVSEAVDAATFNTFTAVSGTTYQCAVPADVWDGLPDGSHTLRITAADSFSSTVLRSVEFEKRSRITATLPTLLSFAIDPDSGNFTAPEFEIVNHEAYPLEITFDGLTPNGETTVRLVTPDAFSDWTKLGAEDTHKNLALGVRQGAQTHWFGGGTAPAFSIPANAAQPFSLEARFGSAWRDAVSLGFDLTFHISIP